MKIGINLLYLIPDIVGGTETYAASLLRGLASIDSRNEFAIFVNRESSNWPLPNSSQFKRIVCPVNGTQRAQRYFFEQAILPAYVLREKIDLLHSLGYVGPVFSPCPTIVTIHDTNYIDLAETMPWQRSIPLRFFSTMSARTAKIVITVSEFSKSRISQLLHLPHEKITVIHEASQLDNFVESKPPDIEKLRNLYGLHRPYIAAFGGGAVHKNIPRLVQAFAQIARKIEHQLVLIGHLPPDYRVDAPQQTPGLQSRVITTGYVPGDHVGQILSYADLFVMPSLYEGFGLPVLEAQQAGTIVACSSAGSLPEVAGAGAVLFDPTSVESIAETVFRCIVDPELRAKLYQEGQVNLKRFSWEKTAQETLAVYHKILD
jgi:glycosyltransferase involved in cell wall biosynthesis